MKTITKFLFFTFFFLQAQSTYSQKQKENIINRTAYMLHYDASWHVDSSDNDFSFDSYFSLDTRSNNGAVTFFIFDTPTDPAEHIEAQVKAYLAKIMKNGSVTYFEKWGSFSGKGALIKGKLLGSFSGEIRVFSYSNNNLSFLIVSQLFDEDKPMDQPGLDLIEKTFRLK